MAQRLMLLALAMVVVAGSAYAFGEDPLPITKRQVYGEHHLLYDPPAAHLNAIQARTQLDTICWGGYDPIGRTAVLWK